MSIIGHSAQQSFFTSCLASGKLSHAYVFVGPRAVGKRALANWLVRQLVQTPLTEDMIHPDVHIVAQELNEKTGKTKKHIDVEQIRALRSHMTKSSMSGGYRIGIIDDAHAMNTAAANALLKTLEEPGASSLLILITPDDTALPATIRSRVHTIECSLVSEREITSELITRGAEPAQAASLAKQSLGRIGDAISWYTMGGADLSEHRDLLLMLVGKPLYQKYALVEPLFGKSVDHIADRQRITRVLDDWLIVLREQLLYAAGIDNKSIATGSTDQLSVPVALNAVSAIQHVQASLAQNVHPRLLLDTILFTLP